MLIAKALRLYNIGEHFQRKATIARALEVMAKTDTEIKVVDHIWESITIETEAYERSYACHTAHQDVLTLRCAVLIQAVAMKVKTDTQLTCAAGETG